MEILNLSSVKNMPRSHESLVFMAVEGLKTIFQDKLVSVYGCGSWLRNESKKGSDVDFYYTIKNSLTKEEAEALYKLKNKLEKDYEQDAIVGVDLRHCDLSKPHYWHMVTRRMIILIDGSLLYGEAMNPADKNMYSTKEVVQSFIYLQLNLIDKVAFSKGVPPSNPRMKKLLTKIVLRTARWLSVLEGSPIMCSIPLYVSKIKIYVPEISDDIEKTYKLYIKNEISNEDIIYLLNVFKKILSILTSKGISTTLDPLDTYQPF